MLLKTDRITKMRLILDIEDNYGDGWALGHNTIMVNPDDDVFQVLETLLNTHKFQNNLASKMDDFESDLEEERSI